MPITRISERNEKLGSQYSPRTRSTALTQKKSFVPFCPAEGRCCKAAEETGRGRVIESFNDRYRQFRFVGKPVFKRRVVCDAQPLTVSAESR